MHQPGLRSWLLAGALASNGVLGCGDDDDGGSGGSRDSGASDGGPQDGGTGDATVRDAAAPVVCGGETCTPHTTALGVSAAGCATNAQGAEVCGISSQSILMGAEPRFLEKDAPGVASQSCAQFYDTLEATTDAGTSGNGLIDTVLMTSGLTVKLRYPDCCTAAGFCSGDTSRGEADLGGGTYTQSNAGYGCLESSIFFGSAPAAVRRIPCNPTSGGIALDGGAGDGGAGDGGAGDGGAGDGGAGDGGAGDGGTDAGLDGG